MYDLRRRATIHELEEYLFIGREAVICIFNENCVLAGRQWYSSDGDEHWPEGWTEETFLDCYGADFPDGDVEIVQVRGKEAEELAEGGGQ